MNVKTKMNCKTESYFLIIFSLVGRIWIRDGPHANHWSKPQWRVVLGVELGVGHSYKFIWIGR